MKKLLLACLLAGCITPAKTLKLQQEFTRTADSSTVSWLSKKNSECIELASKQAEAKEGMDVYATCTLDIFEKATKISNLIDSIRADFKVEAGVLLSIAKGEKSKDSLKELTPKISSSIDLLTLYVSELK